MLTALESRPRVRLIVVGGAANLEVKPGLVFDSDKLLSAAIDGFGLPREYAAAMRGHGAALNLFRISNRLWTYSVRPWKSPPANAPAVSGSAATNPSTAARLASLRGVARPDPHIGSSVAPTTRRPAVRAWPIRWRLRLID